MAERWVPAVGDLVAGRYRIEKMLGQGGMGVVVGAKDEKRDGYSVALKILQMEGHVNLERFLREARVATRIASEHVVKVFDVGVLPEKSEHPFLVMERLEGVDFGARLKKLGGPLPVMTVADCVVQVCEALAHAHGAGVTHRDIKASNVFEHRQADGTTIAKVLDFGIARYRAGEGEAESTLTTTNDASFLGSPPYMSPEHVRDARTVDGRADLWSLGIVAYRLLSGRFPFRGESTGEVLAAILEQDAPLLRELGHDVPDEIDAAIARCLRRSRDDRFSNAADLATAFAPFCSPRWAMLHLQVAEVSRRSPAVLIPEPPSQTKRNSRVDAEPQTMTVAPPVSLSQPPPSLDESRNGRKSRTSMGATDLSTVRTKVRARSKVPRYAIGLVAIGLLGGGLFASRRHLPFSLRGATAPAITAAPPASIAPSPIVSSSSAPPAVTASAVATSSEPAPPPRPTPDAVSAKKRKGRAGRPNAATSAPVSTPPATTPAVTPPPPPPTTKPDLHPNPYGNGE